MASRTGTLLAVLVVVVADNIQAQLATNQEVTFGQHDVDPESHREVAEIRSQTLEVTPIQDPGVKFQRLQKMHSTEKYVESMSSRSTTGRGLGGYKVHYGHYTRFTPALGVSALTIRDGGLTSWYKRQGRAHHFSFRCTGPAGYDVTCEHESKLPSSTEETEFEEATVMIAAPMWPSQTFRSIGNDGRPDDVSSSGNPHGYYQGSFYAHIGRRRCMRCVALRCAAPRRAALRLVEQPNINRAEQQNNGNRLENKNEQQAF